MCAHIPQGLYRTLQDALTPYVRSGILSLLRNPGSLGFWRRARTAADGLTLVFLTARVEAGRPG